MQPDGCEEDVGLTEEVRKSVSDRGEHGHKDAFPDAFGGPHGCLIKCGWCRVGNRGVPVEGHGGYA